MKYKVLFVIPLLLTSFIGSAQDKPVRTVTINKQQVTLNEPVFGTVVSERNARVASEISGKVISIKALGSEVKQGEMIAKIDAEFLRIDLKQAQAQLNKAIAEQPYLETKLKAIKTLSNNNSVSEDEYNLILSRRDINVYQMAQLTEEINMLKERLKRSEIVAPFDGIITELFTQVGEAVDKFDPMVRLLDNQHLALHVEAPAELYQRIAIGMDIEVFDQQTTVMSKVTAKYPIENYNSRKFVFRSAVSNQFVIGSAITVQLPKKQIENAYLIPFDALIKVKQGYQVAMIDTDGKARLAPVSKLFHVNDDVAIASDALPDQFEVITEGNLVINGGDAITMVR